MRTGSATARTTGRRTWLSCAAWLSIWLRWSPQKRRLRLSKSAPDGITPTWSPSSPKPQKVKCDSPVATPLWRCRGGPFVAQVQALPGHPYDGPTLASVIPAIEATVGAELARIVPDAGYKGHPAPKEKRFRVSGAGQKRGLTGALKRAFRRRAAVEPVIGPLKAEHRMGRNYLAHSAGDAINAVLAAAGYNFRLLLRWLAPLCALIFASLRAAKSPTSKLQLA